MTEDIAETTECLSLTTVIWHIKLEVPQMAGKSALGSCQPLELQLHCPHGTRGKQNQSVEN